MRSRKIFSVSPVQETISVLCLILVVAFRSFEGSIFTFPWNSGILTGIALTGAVFLGKMLGGFASDFFGSYKTAAISLAISAILLGVSDRTDAGTCRCPALQYDNAGHFDQSVSEISGISGVFIWPIDFRTISWSASRIRRCSGKFVFSYCIRSPGCDFSDSDYIGALSAIAEKKRPAAYTKQEETGMIQLCILFILSWILTVVVEGGAARLFFGIEKKEQNRYTYRYCHKSCGCPSRHTSSCLHRNPF